jgi:crotonobetainyl-CoA:carnitine CoA-transferase CaiB-like acyl-CoA transferase
MTVVLSSRFDVALGALSDVRVVDMATVLAGPGAARHLADFGADVIKVEAPGGDGTRRLGWRASDGDSYFWKLVNRNKRGIVLDLKSDDGRARLRALLEGADVLVENLRPGTLERLGFAPDELLRDVNPRLVILRVSGFGQTGPYARRPGFATLAEAMSGFAAVNGEPDGPRLLPPIALTDEATALAGAFAVMVALHHRDRTGEGQVVDVNLLETMLQLMGPAPSAYAHLGVLQERMGSQLPYSVPRGTYRCADGVWVAVSASAEAVAARLVELIGAGGDARFATFDDRIAHRVALHDLVAAWIAARPSRDVLEQFAAVDAAVAPVYDMADLFADEHVAAREVLPEVGGVRMQGPVARLSATPAELRTPGPPLPDANEPPREGWQ